MNFTKELEDASYFEYHTQIGHLIEHTKRLDKFEISGRLERESFGWCSGQTTELCVGRLLRMVSTCTLPYQRIVGRLAVRIAVRIAARFVWLGFTAIAVAIDLLANAEELLNSFNSSRSFSQLALCTTLHSIHCLPDLNGFWNADHVLVQLESTSNEVGQSILGV